MAKALDVWLRFESDEDEEPTHEANTYREKDGGVRIEHYHTAVGLVSTVRFPDYADAVDWYTANGYQDFSS